MFERILIANRGEIACRVMDTARRLGVATVAVYSDADRQSRHVEMADCAVHIGGSAPADSYLRGDVIIQAALATGAQAVHPGYGFLSENPEFVEAVLAAGLVSIGPSAAAIRAMGLKDAAKTLMEKSGVPVVPGYHGANQDPQFLAQEAEKIGYPVLIKAVAGGGGKGMRQVAQADGFAQNLASAQAEALSAFANSDVLIEKLVEKPRHIEVQVFGDGEKTVHLYERDCSLQRRHQKVIEEAPAPGMTPDMRAAMCDAAVRAAQAVSYTGAGTVEFIVDASEGLRADRFWFLEMNTRLQVEHPVTEAVTGVDLVEWQLRVAAGERLPLTQDQIELQGHAFEARLYAEDAGNDFLPAGGTLSHLRFSPSARADTGVRVGDSISPWYDPMIAKVITHGATRELALNQLSAALAATEVAGTITNLTFLGKLTRNGDVASGDVDTGLISREFATLAVVPPPDPAVLALALITAAGPENCAANTRGFTLWSAMEQNVALRIKDEDISGHIALTGPTKAHVTVQGKTLVLHLSGGHWRLPDTQNIRAQKIGGSVSVFAATSWHFDIPDPLEVGSAAAFAGNVITAPMPGLIRAVLVKAGQTVAEGDRLMVLEAMKMEHALRAPRDGVIEAVLVAADDQVEAEAALIMLQDDGQ